ncbi:alpha/beta hydrolase [Streptomyces sp. NBC_00576]|uniref:alpha/beta hydrolase n=1 Tax=Streptomyces sp. NBC_00576 TaxID=2903665 RepID=UPI002E805595|nr:alpha/beta hydrolase [Streptomyces sp. NBC_00576]WUB76929.1 alpha/beta hydrolase [Streptomyces sp. NBC_00576]
MRTSVTFMSNHLTLAGTLYLPDDYDGRPRSAVVVGHPAGGVKEQTAGRYAEELSRKGFVALAYDAPFQGESEGEPRGLEDPFQHAEGVRAAVSFVSTRSEVDPQRIGGLGICASGAYVPYAAQTDRRMKAVATVSAVDPGAELLAEPAVRDHLLDQAAVFRTLEAREGSAYATNLLPGTQAEADALPAGSMFGESYGYYRTPLGQHPRSSGWGVARFDLIAQFEPYRNNSWLAPRPLLMIVGSEAGTRVFSEDGVARAGGTAELFDITGATHFDLYHRDEYVSQAVDKLADFYSTHLKN